LQVFCRFFTGFLTCLQNMQPYRFMRTCKVHVLCMIGYRHSQKKRKITRSNRLRTDIRDQKSKMIQPGFEPGSSTECEWQATAAYSDMLAMHGRWQRKIECRTRKQKLPGLSRLHTKCTRVVAGFFITQPRFHHPASTTTSRPFHCLAPLLTHYSSSSKVTD
jgi:hypothetical protein